MHFKNIVFEVSTQINMHAAKSNKGMTLKTEFWLLYVRRRYSPNTRYLTLTPLTWTIWRAPTNASKWRMGFNSAFKGLKGPSTHRVHWLHERIHFRPSNGIRPYTESADFSQSWIKTCCLSHIITLRCRHNERHFSSSWPWNVYTLKCNSLWGLLSPPYNINDCTYHIQRTFHGAGSQKLRR